MAVSFSQMGEELYRGAYAATEHNPIYAIRAFLVFHALGLYPPHWVLDWLNQAFTTYLQSNGRKSMEALLGVKRGKGQTPIVKEMRALDAEANILTEMLSLNAVGVSVADAASMVAGRYEVTGVKCPTTETLAERFTKREWGKATRQLKAVLGEVPTEAIFAAYPKHTHPKRRK